jgi:hypothetical protein
MFLLDLGQHAILFQHIEDTWMWERVEIALGLIY